MSEKLNDRTDKGGKQTEALKYFEIHHPVPQATTLDVVYELIQIGITKAKVFAVEVINPAVSRWILEIPPFTQDLLEKLKRHFISTEEIDQEKRKKFF